MDGVGWVDKQTHIQRRDTCASWYTEREKPSRVTKYYKGRRKKTDNGGKRYNATLFYTEHAIDFFTVLGFYLMRVQKKKGEAGTCQDIVIES